MSAPASRKLAGKIALITGASRGIGRAIALKLAAEGAGIIVNYASNRNAANEVVAEVERLGSWAFAVQGDVGSVKSIHSLFATIDSELERRTGSKKFDILINNAGIAVPAPFEETTEELFDRHFDINVKGLFFVTQSALPRLRDNGRIINVTSAVTRIAFPGIPAYSATKGAVNTLTLHLAPIAGARGITVNNLAPGAIDTDMNAAWIRTPEARKSISEQAAIKRVGEVDDVAGAALFLASPESAWVTAQYLEASGGAHL